MFNDLEGSSLRSGQYEFVIVVVVADKLASEVELQVENLTHLYRIALFLPFNNHDVRLDSHRSRVQFSMLCFLLRAIGILIRDQPERREEFLHASRRDSAKALTIIGKEMPVLEADLDEIIEKSTAIRM